MLYTPDGLVCHVIAQYDHDNDDDDDGDDDEYDDDDDDDDNHDDGDVDVVLKETQQNSHMYVNVTQIIETDANQDNGCK